MAGRKKQSEQTAEEKLQQALVPEAEQPYKVPDNWCWVKQNIICGLADADKISNGELPYLEVKYLRGNKEAKLVNEGKFIERSSKVILVDGENSGEVFDIPTDGYMGSTFRLLYFTNAVNEIYCRYFISLKKEIYSKNKKGSAIPHLNKDLFFSMPFPLPPLTEQQRIVERIETLFSKLDKAKEKLQNTLDTFETRKAAILHKAFSGELMGKKSDKITTLENIVETIKIGPFGSSLHKEDYIEDGVPVINPKHIVNQRVVADNKVSISIKKAEELSSYKLQENDIILGRRGEMGRSAPINKSEEGWICGTGSLIIRLKKGYNALFYSQIIASQTVVQYLDSNSVGSTLKNLNEKIVRKIPIPDYTLDEQTEIVRIIDNLLAKEQQAHSVAQNAITKIDLIKKSILARAFRGQLAANNPADEPAIELLKKVL